jgi:hypothetical protein
MAFTAVAAAIAASMGTTLAVITSITLLAIGFAVSLYLMLNWSLIIPVTVLEGGWFRVSSRRSRALIQGSRWRVFVIYLLMGLLAGVVTVMLEFLLLFSISLLRIRDYRTVQMIAQVVVAVALFMGISIVGALATISLSLVYFDQRVRKEGFDLQLMMATLQQATPPPPATAPVS